MTLKQLEVFVAIADTRSFSNGAERSCITQSTASQHIHALEEELGIRLFDRGRGGALFTAAGKLFYVRAKKILMECEETRSAIKRFIGLENVLLRVGASNIPGTWLIPSVLSEFHKECPKVRLEVIQSDSKTVLNSLINEDIELGYIGGIFEDERIDLEAIGDDSIVCAVSPEFTAGRKTILTQEEFSKFPLVVREDGSGTQKAVYEALAKTWINKESLNVVAVLGSSEAIRRAVLNGAGYGFISNRAISEDISNGLLVTVKIPWLNITRKFYAARRGGREMSPAASAFHRTMMSFCSEMKFQN